MKHYTKLSDDELSIISPYFSLKINRDSYNKNLSIIKKGFLLGHSKNKIQNIKVTTVKEWTSISSETPSVQWHFHTLGRGCGILLAMYKEYPEASVLLHSIISLWSKANSESQNFRSTEQAWAGHTVALRLDFLIACYLIFDDLQKDDIRNLILLHIEFLKKEENYDGHWNHGLDQSIALLKASYIFNDTESHDIALNRILINFEHSFDEQGVNNEQAIMYHNYNIERFSYAKELISLFDSNVSTFNSTLDKARYFLLHAIDPNGNYSMLGDTIMSPPMFRHDSSDINYLTSKSNSGTVPNTSTSAIYKSGFVFGRSSWNYQDNPSYYTLRFGPARIIHGHNDHTSLTYFSNKQAIIIDGGFNGYGNDEFRHFFRSPQAHNVIFCPSNEKFKWDSPTTLKYHKKTDHFDLFFLTDEPYEGTKRSRVVLFDLSLDCFYVHDRITANEGKEFVQNWNFSPSTDVKTHKDHAELSTMGKKYNFYFDNESCKVSIFKGFKKIKKNKTLVEGGFSGLGHNHTEENYCLRVHKKGTDITWDTFFIPFKHDIKNENKSFIIDNSIKYSMRVENNQCYVKKEFINKNVGFRSHASMVEYDGDYSKEKLGFMISNDSENKKFFTLDLGNIIKTCSNVSAIIDFSITKIKGEPPSYYYISSKKGVKNRFGDITEISCKTKETTTQMPINPNSQIVIELKFREIETIESLDFPLE